MHITHLGHSCVLLGFEDQASTKQIRILIDPWLSDHATGDGMGRFPRIRFDANDLDPIHGIFISHAHCDHLDPYTLIALWKQLATPPALLLPVSLLFLKPLFEEHLNSPDIIVLHPHQSVDFQGVQLMGMYDIGSANGNEEDVMILVLTHHRTRVLVEADARLSLEFDNFRQYISMLMCAPNIDSAVYLTTENELTGTIDAHTCSSIEERQELYQAVFEELYDAIHQLYEPIEDPMHLWHNPSLIRIIHGQGLTAPHELNAHWQNILFPVRIADRVRIEREVSQAHGFQHTIDALTVGHIHTIRHGKIENHQPVQELQLIDQEVDRQFQVNLPFFPKMPCAPLHNDVRIQKKQEERILNLLNHVFLPYLYGQRQPPVLHLLADCQGEYRIRIVYGTEQAAKIQDYILNYESYGFAKSQTPTSTFHEQYWANDIEDFLDGTCDEFSVFCRQPLPCPNMRLWVCLATPLLHSRLAYKRVALHFARATNGLTAKSWVMKRYEITPS